MNLLSTFNASLHLSQTYSWVTSHIHCDTLFCSKKMEKDEDGISETIYMLIAWGFCLQVLHFLEKNKDTLRSDVVELMCESKNKVGV